jgi:hypothetical protein
MKLLAMLSATFFDNLHAALAVEIRDHSDKIVYNANEGFSEISSGGQHDSH